jgi:hypothetical protein
VNVGYTVVAGIYDAFTLILNNLKLRHDYVEFGSKTISF